MNLTHQQLEAMGLEKYPVKYANGTQSITVKMGERNAHDRKIYIQGLKDMRDLMNEDDIKEFNEQIREKLSMLPNADKLNQFVESRAENIEEELLVDILRNNISEQQRNEFAVGFANWLIIGMSKELIEKELTNYIETLK